MATKSQNLFRVLDFDVITPLPFDASVTALAPINQGDMAYYTGNGATQGIAPVPAGAMSAALVAALKTFIGVSDTQAPMAYNNEMPLSCQIKTKGVFEFYTTAGDTYKEFDEVTVGADPQTVVKTATLATLAPVSAVDSGGVVTPGFSAGVHQVQTAWLSPAGFGAAGPALASAAITATHGITVTWAAIPAWATGIGVFVDGYLVGTFYTGTTGTVNGPASGVLVPVASTDALTIGEVRLPAIGNKVNVPIVGGAGFTVQVYLRTRYPRSMATL